MHSGEKPFACSVCEYRCSSKSDLVVHERVHSGEKPFACSVCEYRCSSKSHLVRHERVHVGEKSFTCSTNMERSFVTSPRCEVSCDRE